MKEKVKQLLLSIKREGMEKLIEALDKVKFYVSYKLCVCIANLSCCMFHPCFFSCATTEE